MAFFCEWSISRDVTALNGLTDIFNFVAKLMPAATPGSLKPDVDVAIMAFLLKQNGYPAGERPLSYDEAAKSSVALRFYGK